MKTSSWSRSLSSCSGIRSPAGSPPGSCRTRRARASGARAASCRSARDPRGAGSSRHRGPWRKPSRECEDPRHVRGGGSDVRLRDRRRRLGRLRAGQPPERGRRRARAAGRGRAARHGRLHPHPGGLQRPVPHPARLGPHDGLGAGRRQPAHLSAARADARRLVVAERDDLHARQPARLRRVARRRLHRLGLGRPAALLQARRGQRARRERVPRRRRTAAGQRGAGAQRHVPGLPGGRRRAGPARQRRLQRRRAGRLRLVPGHAARRPPGEHRRRLPAPGRWTGPT